MLLLPLELQATFLIFLKDKDFVHLSQTCHHCQSYYCDYKIRNLMSTIKNNNINYQKYYDNYFYTKQFLCPIKWINQFDQYITLVQLHHPWERYCQPLVQCDLVRYSKYKLLKDDHQWFIVFCGHRYYKKI